MTLGTFCHAKAPDEQEAIDCATKRCANTPIGEDPETLQLRVGKHMQDDFRRDPNDAKRWSSVIIFSKSAHKDNLTMPIITSSNLRMTLNPDKGILQFSSPAATQSFKIASPLPHKQNELCPKYQLRVLDGTPDYALIEKACPMREYEPRRFFRSTTYYIYDMKSATMREIWMGARGFDTISPFPSAEPQIVLKKIKDGYQFDWQGMSADDAPPILVRIHRAYKREHDRQGNVGLVCYDTTKPQHPLKENESCESEILERVLP
jgi:hypothetical protein